MPAPNSKVIKLKFSHYRRRNLALQELGSSSELEPASRLCHGSGGGDGKGGAQFPQVFRHSILLLLLVCSIIADLSLAIWQLAATQADTGTGAYRVMLALNVILTTGQGILIFSIFILDCHFIINPTISLARKVTRKVLVESGNFPVLSKIWAD